MNISGDPGITQLYGWISGLKHIYFHDNPRICSTGNFKTSSCGWYVC